MKPIIQFCFCLVLIASMLFGAFGCKSLKKAVDASARLSAQVNNLQDQIEKSYDQKLIDAEFSRKATLLVKDKLNPAVAAYTNFVDELRGLYPAGTEAKPTSEQWSKLRTLFRAVTSAFAEISTAFKLLTPEQSILLTVIIAAIQESIEIIGGAVSKVDQHIENGGAAWLKLQTS